MVYSSIMGKVTFILSVFLLFKTASVVDATDCRFGPGCKYDCNCAETSICDPQAGCQGNCTPGWDGPTCQRENVALDKITNQSSTLSSKCDGKDTYFPSENAANGKVGYIICDVPCTHTDPTHTGFPSWNVNLGGGYYIYQFKIYNRKEGCGDGVQCGARLNGFILSVGNALSASYSECYRDTTTSADGPGAIIHGTCTSSQPIFGDTVKISLTTENIALTLCEVLIYICSKDWYGDVCNRECVTNVSCKHCDTTGFHCEECVVGRYGEDCLDNCGHCWNNNPCKKQSGECPLVEGSPRCEPGYKGTQCKENCTAGTYGPDCHEDCGFCAEGQTVCNIVSGKCPSTCIAGYTGQNCKTECSDSTWGANCVHDCGQCYEGIACNKSSGVCPITDGKPRCSPGYMEINCTILCKESTWGADCVNDCGNCYDGTACNRASGVCPILEGNPRCSPGFKDIYCSFPCIDSTWGADCVYDCGQCYEGNICNKSSGVCPLTDEKPRCSPGYMEVNCDTPCQSGLWGDNCVHQCSENCIRTCEVSAGICVEGCIPGFEGERCQSEIPIPQQDVGGIVGGIIGALILATATVVGIIVLYRRGQIGRFMKRREDTLPANDLIGQGPRFHGVQQENHAFDDDLLNEPVDQQHIYQNSSLSSTSVSVDRLREYVKEKITHGGLKAEFEKFPEGLQHEHRVADKPQNKQKSRYKYVVAYDHSRVILTTLNDQPNSDYINACYIDGFVQRKRYVASQGATIHNIDDFMRMIWEQNVGKVVMLTNLVENAKEKCRQYWPDEGSRRFGLITVTMEDEEVFADFIIRTFQLTHSKVKNECRTVTQFHFTTWPDHGVPSDACGLLDFRSKVLDYESPWTGPIVVHCSAGIGRTGTFIALDYLITQARQERIVDFPGCLRLLRGQRVNMIQNLEQYVFLHEALAQALIFDHSSVCAANISSIYSELSSVNRVTGETKMMEQFQDMNVLATPIDESSLATARHPDNIDKNRSLKILAADRFRPFLSTPVTGGNNYINAVFLPSYKKKTGFMQTQTPLPHTVVDFWRLVYEQDVNTIVMLDDVKEDDQNVGIYWPERTQKFLPFEVETTGVMQKDNFYVRTLELTYKNTKVSHPISLYHCNILQDLDFPSSISSLLDAINSVDEWQKETGSEHILVHCRDGATLSGLFCAAFSVIQRLQVDQKVNIPLTVKRLRLNRPEIITDKTQFQFLYQMVMTYLESQKIYVNCM